jgi:nicotinamidase-related amidase
MDSPERVAQVCSHDPSVAERAAHALAAARTAGLPVFHVVPQGMGEQIHPLLAPAEGETVLTKTSFSAFATTDLREQLEAAGVGRIVVAGVATSGTVLSTTRWAVDTGLRVTVCADACEELYRAVAHRRRPADRRDPRAAGLT